MTVNEDPGILLYTRIRKSPYFHASRKHGVARYSVYNHTYHPRHYGDPVAEYWHLVNAVTLWDVGVEKQIQIKGPDAFDLTNMIVPRDLNKCAVDQCKYVFITGPDGGILNDPVLLRVEEDEFWLSLADSDVNLYALGIAAAKGMDVTVQEIDVAPVQIQGPNAKKVLVELFGDAILDVPYYGLMKAELDGMQVVISRTGYTGEVGYEIYLRDASEHGVALWDRVLEAGKPHDLRVIGPCHIRRIEGGILAFGADMWYENNPFEVGYHYTWMVDLEQEADFMGKEALKRIKAEGVRQKLVGVDIEGEPLGTYIDNEMLDFFPASANGSVVGRVTSACYSPRLEKNIGLAMLPIEHTELGHGAPGRHVEGHGRRDGRPDAALGPDEGDPEGLTLDPGGEHPEHAGPFADVILRSGARVDDHDRSLAIDQEAPAGPVGELVLPYEVRGQVARIGPVRAHHPHVFVALPFQVVGRRLERRRCAPRGLERDPCAVGRPGRIPLVALRRGREVGLVRPVGVDHEHVVVGVAERRRAAHRGRERDPGAVGRPRRILAPDVRELPRVRAVGVHHEELRHAVLVGRVCDPSAVRGPDRSPLVRIRRSGEVPVARAVGADHRDVVVDVHAGARVPEDDERPVAVRVELWATDRRDRPVLSGGQREDVDLAVVAAEHEAPRAHDHGLRAELRLGWRWRASVPGGPGARHEQGDRDEGGSPTPPRWIHAACYTGKRSGVPGVRTPAGHHARVKS